MWVFLFNIKFFLKQISFQNFIFKSCLGIVWHNNGAQRIYFTDGNSDKMDSIMASFRHDGFFRTVQNNNHNQNNSHKNRTQRRPGQPRDPPNSLRFQASDRIPTVIKGKKLFYYRKHEKKL